MPETKQEAGKRKSGTLNKKKTGTLNGKTDAFKENKGTVEKVKDSWLVGRAGKQGEPMPEKKNNRRSYQKRLCNYIFFHLQDNFHARDLINSQLTGMKKERNM